MFDAILPLLALFAPPTITVGSSVPAPAVGSSVGLPGISLGLPGITLGS
ncbi:hypothetical protein [Rhodococcus spelaei]|nr:hypothetical protein [Rhodococcus spelaei]